MTRTAARAAKVESRMAFTGELMAEKIPKATPVFLTYVMLKNPSITEIESSRSNFDWIRSLVQRSSARIAATSTRYGRRPVILDAMKAKL